MIMKKNEKFGLIILSVVAIGILMALSLVEEDTKTKEKDVNASKVIRRTVETDFDIEQMQVKPDTIKLIEQSESNLPSQDKPRINLIDLERGIHDLINQQRIAHGLKELEWDDKLAYIALSHSNDLITSGNFSHISSEGLDPTERANKLGYKCEKIVGNLTFTGIGENLLQNYLYDRVTYVNEIPISYDWKSRQEIAQSTVDGLMISQSHRENILDDTFDREGIGVFISKDDSMIITQNLC